MCALIVMPSIKMRNLTSRWSDSLAHVARWIFDKTRNAQQIFPVRLHSFPQFHNFHLRIAFNQMQLKKTNKIHFGAYINASSELVHCYSWWLCGFDAQKWIRINFHLHSDLFGLATMTKSFRSTHRQFNSEASLPWMPPCLPVNGGWVGRWNKKR